MKKHKSKAKDEAVANRNATRNEVNDHLLCPILELPMCLQHEIFFRLAIKDIMRCKCVCTLWQNHISVPHFSENYVKNSNLTQLLYLPGNLSPRAMYLLEISENGDCSSSQMDPKLPPLPKTPYYSFVGSCNGFICLLLNVPGLARLSTKGNRKVSTDEIICVGNPIFGDDYVALPKRKKPTESGRRVVSYQFGFTPHGNDFKVLRFAFIYDDYRRPRNIGASDQELLTPASQREIEECEIFSVGVDNQWRSLSICFTDLGQWCDVVSYGGALNWIPCTKSPVCISTFDIAGEKLGQIPSPPDLVLVRDKTELKIFNNEFSVLDFTNVPQITLWIMKKYGAADSWTKFVISMSSFPFGREKGYYFRPVAELQDGEILFSNTPEDRLFSYNLKQNKCSIVDIHAVGVDRIWFWDINTYVPNFFCRGKKLQ